MNTIRRNLVPARQNRSNPATNWQRPRAILSAAIIPLSVIVASALAMPAHADSIFAPGNSIFGGQVNTGNFVVAVNGGSGNDYPTGEEPLHAIDGVAQKYLNFGQTNTGIL